MKGGLSKFCKKNYVIQSLSRHFTLFYINIMYIPVDIKDESERWLRVLFCCAVTSIFADKEP